MVIKAFPPVEEADEYGIIGIGGDLEVESLVLAYSSGIFPWPIWPETLTWFAPEKRAILKVSDYRRPASLKRVINSGKFKVEIDKNFEAVINKCRAAKNRGAGQDTWITEQICQGYINLHYAGFAHSIEAYNKDRLVGGLYGVSIGMFFAGESMFRDEDNASKVCLDFMVNYLRNRGVDWFDCQVISPFTQSLGANEISRDEYMQLLKEQLRLDGNLF
jgi:leucyl/phenylalanyl-tRNA--protein transferase